MSSNHQRLFINQTIENAQADISEAQRLLQRAANKLESVTNSNYIRNSIDFADSNLEFAQESAASLIREEAADLVGAKNILEFKTSK